MIKVKFKVIKKTSVASIVSSVADVIRDLEEHAKAQAKASIAKENAAAKLMKEVGEHEKELVQAEKVVANFRELLG